MSKERKLSEYEDMIYLPHPESMKHPRMSIHDRAAQFAPFAALSGYEDAIRETVRLNEEEMQKNTSGTE